MGVGFILADGSFAVPPASDSRLASITVTMLVRQLVRQGEVVREMAVGLPELARRLDAGKVAGLFAASTGKGLAVAGSIRIGATHRPLAPPAERVDRLWRAYAAMHEAHRT